MTSTRINIGLLLLPSMRSLAYLSVFEQLGLCPSEIYWLEGGSLDLLDGLIKEDQKYNYSSSFFDLNFDVQKYISKNNIEVRKINSSDINSDLVRQAIESSKCDYILFTGGGILKKHTLSVEKKLIHVHPGILPEFRGSTCFYYSILQNNTLGSSAIFLEEEIDTGEVISSSRFSINYYINSDQPMFMDHVLDPFIRAYTLKKVLNIYKQERIIKGSSQDISIYPAYYVMHPVLRHIAIERINSIFRVDKPVGIFEI